MQAKTAIKYSRPFIPYNYYFRRIEDENNSTSSSALSVWEGLNLSDTMYLRILLIQLSAFRFVLNYFQVRHTNQ